jgi:DNA-binding NarL/FixJ family response regulator
VSTDGYTKRAEQHRPHDPAALEAEIVRLAQTGLTINDIASALRIEQSQIAAVLIRASLGATRR